MARSRSPFRSRSRSPERERGPARRSSPGRRSPMDEGDQSQRRRSPDREKRRRHDAGFRWKDKKRDGDRSRDNERRSERSHRPSQRSRSPERAKLGKGHESEKPSRPEGRSDEGPRDAKTKMAPPPSAAGGEPMIIVHVNDRLGTKAAIPCLASDPIGGCTSYMLIKLRYFCGLANWDGKASSKLRSPLE